MLIRAASLLAQGGDMNGAVDVLGRWEDLPDVGGFLDAYLRVLASLPAGAQSSRLKLLAGRARLRQGQAANVVAEMEPLARDADPWTALRAQASLIELYSQQGAHEKVIATYQSLGDAQLQGFDKTAAAQLCARSLLRSGRVQEATRLLQDLLAEVPADAFPREDLIRRRLARILAHSGQMPAAIDMCQKATACFERAGDCRQGAVAYGLLGDLLREAGDFQGARDAFAAFAKLAGEVGDREMMQIATLADSWLALDIGDLTKASRAVAAVEKEAGAAPSRRLRRYLNAANALLLAARGQYQPAATELARVIEQWDSAGQQTIVGVLRAQQIRCLIAIGNLDKASELVDSRLRELDRRMRRRTSRPCCRSGR